MNWKLKKIFFKIDPFDDRVPWMNYAAINWLDGYLTSVMDVFEWGSGGSTFYFSQKVNNLISVEHDHNWYKKVRQKLRDEKTNNIKYFICPPSRFIQKTSNYYMSSDENYKNKTFDDYCEKILEYSDNSFDLIVIDGRARPGCAINSLNKVKEGGYILLDNSERKNYASIFKLLKGWKKTEFYGNGPLNKYPWKTTIFQKSTA